MYSIQPLSTYKGEVANNYSKTTKTKWTAWIKTLSVILKTLFISPAVPGVTKINNDFKENYLEKMKIILRHTFYEQTLQ